MHPYLFAAAMAVALFGAPLAGKSAANAISVFDPLTCAMAFSGSCSTAQMVAHRLELEQASAGG